MRSFLTLIILLFLTLGRAHADTSDPVVHSFDGIDVEYYEVDENKIFSNVFFLQASEELHFQTNNEITSVQIYNEEGQIKFQLPVNGSHMVFKKHLLEEGQYKIGFIMKNDPTVHFTKITSK